MVMKWLLLLHFETYNLVYAIDYYILTCLSHLNTKLTQVPCQFTAKHGNCEIDDNHLSD